MNTLRVSVSKKVGLACLMACVAVAAVANPRDQAKRMYDRIAGTPPTEQQLDQMAAMLPANPVGAALVATESLSFYDVTLKNMAVPWTNRDQTVFAPLNDYVATFIGMVRDDTDFRQALSGDIAYTVAGVTPAASPNNNTHYANAEASHVHLKDALTFTAQSTLLQIPPAATAGLMTSRASAEAFFIDGTNRAVFRFTLINHLCRDMEQVLDTSRPADRIRQDVSRSPGGDSRIFLNNCVGCHSGMDPLAQALAFYDFDNGTADAPGTMRLVFTDGVVQAKYFNNNTNFPPGFITPDSSWENRWRVGQNSVLGWDALSEGLPSSGMGAKSMGQELSHSKAFAECQVQKVFKTVCLRMPTQAQITSLRAGFEANGFRLKRVFAEAAALCMGAN